MNNFCCFIFYGEICKTSGWLPNVVFGEWSLRLIRIKVLSNLPLVIRTGTGNSNTKQYVSMDLLPFKFAMMSTAFGLR